jgi:DNA adenine methylase
MLEKVEKIIINDFDKSIFLFWKSILENPDNFIKKIRSAKLDLREWNNQKKIYQGEITDDLSIAFSTFYLNRTNRSGIIGGGPIGGRQQSGKWGIDARFNKEELIQRIERISLYKKRIQVTNFDGIELIKKFKNKKKKFFLYLDPPYYIKGNCLYLNHYHHKDHENLATFLNKNANMNWILSYDNAPEIASFYKERTIQEFSLNYHADTARKGFEFLILSDSIRLPERNNQFS